MPKILIVCTGYTSNLLSSIGLAEELKGSGHSIVFAAPKGVAGRIERSGFTVVSVPPAQCNAFSGYAGRYDFGVPTVAKFIRRRSTGVEAVLSERFGQTLQAVKPDLVLSDCEHHSAILQTLATGLPLGLLSFMYFMPSGESSPPLNSAIVPGHGLTGSAMAIRLRWIVFHARWNLKLYFNILRYWGADFATVHRALAQRLGVDLARISENESFQAPWSYKLPTLYLLPKELNLPVTLSDYHVFAGPKSCLPTTAAKNYSNCDPWIESKAERKIFVSFGTVRKPPTRYLRSLVKVAQRRPDWCFLVTALAGKKLSGSELPDNVVAVEWSPQKQMLEIADCAICHGGAGTVVECLTSRTPVIVVPNGLDGKGNGARVRYHGIGQIGNRNDRAKKIEKTLENVMSSGRVTDNLGRLNAGASGHEDIADRFVEQLMQTKSAAE